MSKIYDTLGRKFNKKGAEGMQEFGVRILDKAVLFLPELLLWRIVDWEPFLGFDLFFLCDTNTSC